MINYTLARVYLNIEGIPNIPKGTGVTINDTCRPDHRKFAGSRLGKYLYPDDRIQVRSEAGFLAWVDAEHLEMNAP